MNTFVDNITRELKKQAPVRTELPAGGRVHIDRPLPFICVYRRPGGEQDPGTDQLLLGEAAYILDLSGGAGSADVRSLLLSIAAVQQEVFGAFLVFEIWAARQGEAIDTKTLDPPQFRIVAPQHHAPKALLEALESRLLDVELEGLPAQVELNYQRDIAPPGMPPVIDAHTDKQSVLLGLEVKPVYRNANTGELFPFELKNLHRQLTHALRQAFYVFTHEYTSHRLKHFHELGRRDMTPSVTQTDEQLAAVAAQFDILLHVTPVNTRQAWREFQSNNYGAAPEFNYRPRPVDPDLLKRRLFQIPIEEIEDPTLAHIFAAKRDELDRQLTMISDRNTPRFLYESLQIYGIVDEPLRQLAEKILQTASPESAPAEEGYVDAGEFARLSQQELDYYRQTDPQLPAQVQLRDDVPGIMVSRGHFLISADARIPANRVDASLSHEIGTHILTYYNGRNQPFKQLYVGMSNYEPLQEGLAVLSEYLVGQLSAARLRLLAARVMAVHALAQGADFVEVYRQLAQAYGFAPPLAFNVAMRVFRGGGYTKDMVYLRGLTQVLHYLGNGGDFELLLMGKLCYEHLEFIDELRWRRVLHKGQLQPKYLLSDSARAKLAALATGMSVLDLLEGVP